MTKQERLMAKAQLLVEAIKEKIEELDTDYEKKCVAAYSALEAMVQSLSETRAKNKEALGRELESIITSLNSVGEENREKERLFAAVSQQVAAIVNVLN